MTKVPFDTRKYIDALLSIGIPEAQARKSCETMVDDLAGSDKVRAPDLKPSPNTDSARIEIKIYDDAITIELPTHIMTLKMMK